MNTSFESDTIADLPIGVFDSGVGGLTVLKALIRRLPDENYLYLGDTARLPYGSRSQKTIIHYASQVSRFLVERHIKMLVIACNTATVAALPRLCEMYPDLPVIGVVEPGAEAACRASVSGNIAVIATEATIRSNAYQKAILRRRPDAKVISVACPLFTHMAEDGLLEGPLAEGMVYRYLQPIFSHAKDDQPDCLVLGCTHYPLLVKSIRAVVGADVRLVDSAATTAEVVSRVLLEKHLACFPRTDGGQYRFLTTDNKERFIRTGSLFLGEAINEDSVQLIDLESLDA